MRLLLFFSFTLFAGLFWGAVVAETLDIEQGIEQGAQADQTIYLEADQVEIDDKQKISTYQGNVKLSRGEITLLADKITAQRNNKGLGKFLATGNPVTFSKAPRVDQKGIKGQALEIEYDAEKEIMKLKKKAKLWQANDQFSGNLIIYNIAQESVTANKGGEKNGRVQVIIHPDSRSTDNNHQNNQ